MKEQMGKSNLKKLEKLEPDIEAKLMAKSSAKNEKSPEKEERKPFGAPNTIAVKPKYEVPADLKPKIRPKSSKIVIKEEKRMPNEIPKNEPVPSHVVKGAKIG
jgi:hypothetical protein